MRLFKCKMNALGGEAYVLAEDEGAAVSAAETQFAEWGYSRERGRVVAVELLAEEGKYPTAPNNSSKSTSGSVGIWLVVPTSGKGKR